MVHKCYYDSGITVDEKQIPGGIIVPLANHISWNQGRHKYTVYVQLPG